MSGAGADARGRRRRRGAIAVAAAIAAIAAAQPVRWTYSAFSATTGAGATFTAKADWTAPSVGATVVRKTEGGIAGFVRPGGTYHVFASTTDAGNPPSGVASAGADVSALTSGATAAALGAGAYSVQGTAYDRRTTTAVTANAVLADGGRTYALSVTDAAGNSRTSTGHAVTVDGTRPQANNLGAGNADGGTAGRLEQGDFMPMWFDEPMDPQSVVAGWTGASPTTVLVQIDDSDAANGGRDTLRICATGAAGTPCAPTVGLGWIDLGSTAWVSADRSFTGSSLSWNGAGMFELRLGTPSAGGGFGTTSATNMTWHPEAVAFDRAGNLAQTTPWSESLGDTDF